MRANTLQPLNTIDIKVNINNSNNFYLYCTSHTKNAALSALQ